MTKTLGPLTGGRSGFDNRIGELIASSAALNVLAKAKSLKFPDINSVIVKGSNALPRGTALFPGMIRRLH
jgi:hypothetical protein